MIDFANFCIIYYIYFNLYIILSSLQSKEKKKKKKTKTKTKTKTERNMQDVCDLLRIGSLEELRKLAEGREDGDDDHDYRGMLLSRLRN